MLGVMSLGSACYSSDSCVAEGAAIATPTGLRPIEALRVGDAVWAVDPRTGERVSTRIVAIRSATRECLALQLPGEGALVCTPDHPIYVAELGTYLPAVSFVEGKARQILQVDDDGARVVSVQAVRVDIGMRRVFDITVESEHHDFVANGVLVHNKSPACDSAYEPCNDPGTGTTGSNGPTGGDSTGGDSTGGTATDDGATGSTTGSGDEVSSGSDTSGSSGSSDDAASDSSSGSASTGGSSSGG